MPRGTIQSHLAQIAMRKDMPQSHMEKPPIPKGLQPKPLGKVHMQREAIQRQQRQEHTQRVRKQMQVDMPPIPKVYSIMYCLRFQQILAGVVVGLHLHLPLVGI